jgi:hypothetical protein
MAKTVWNPADRQALLARFDKLSTDQRPLWGKMSVTQMLKHCTVPIYAAMGESPVTLKKTFFRFWPMQKLIIYVLPWPQGAPTAPEFIITDDGDIDERRAALRAAVDKFVGRGLSQTMQPHAAFGPLSVEDWGALHHKHLEHHLKQFGA